MMPTLTGKRLCRALFLSANIPATPIHSRSLIILKALHPQLLTSSATDSGLPRGVFFSSLSASQERSAKYLGSGVELRDLANHNKVHKRFLTTEFIETVFLEKKKCTYLHKNGRNVVLSEKKTGDQIEVSENLFGKAVVYLTEDLPVTLKLYDGEVISASVPNRVRCMVVDPTEESDIASLSSTSPRRYKRVLLDNGLIVLVPTFIDSGDEIVIKTEDNTYFSRAPPKN